VLFIIRRLGCPICRTTCLLLSSLKPHLDAKGIKLVGVTFQTGEELRSFLEGHFFHGDLFLDESRESYKATGVSGICGVFSLIRSFIMELSSPFRARMKDVTSNNNELSTVYSVVAAVASGELLFFPVFLIACFCTHKTSQ